MFKLTELPIFGGVAQAAKTYVKVTLSILSHPISFPRNIEYADRGELKKAIEYILASVVVTYLILIPLFLKYDNNTSQGFFLLFRFFQYLFLFICIHLTFKALGATKTIAVTVILQCYMIGFFVPIGTLLNLPYILKVGPEIVLGGFDTMVNQDLARRSSMAIQDTTVNISFLLFFALNIWGMFLTLKWLAAAYEFTKKRAFAGIIVGTLVGFAVLEFVWEPIWKHMDDLVISLLRFT